MSQIDVDQFYGIELGEFAARIAEVAPHHCQPPHPNRAAAAAAQEEWPDVQDSNQKSSFANRHKAAFTRGACLLARDVQISVIWRWTMKFNITLDRDEDGVWIAECPSIPGCVSQGKTKAEAAENIKEAIALCLEVRAEQGLPLTIETQQIEVAA